MVGLSTLVLFQNCTNDVGFDSEPSAERIASPPIDTVNPNGIGVGGNSDVVIRINETPSDATVDNGDAVVDYEITTPTGTITNVICDLDGTAVACTTVDRIPISNPGVGPHTFTITATNSDGKTGTEAITWTIYRAVITMTKDINVAVAGTQVDIIINVDNSGSMEFEQNSMASRIKDFMKPFAGLDYHIAITTTSPIGNNVIWKPSLNYVDGKFVPLDNAGTFCIRKSVHNEAQAQALIQNSVVRDLNLLDDLGNILVDANGKTYPEGNGWERGIYTTYRALERDVSGLQGEACLRQGVPKHVIVISDERETLVNPNNGDELPEIAKSSGDSLRQYVAANYGANTVFKFHSIIVDPYTPEGLTCLAGQGARSGVEYGKLSRDTGGYIGSVCAADYSTQLGLIGQIISNSALSYPLDCVSIASNGSKGAVTSLPGGQAVTTAYQFNGSNIDFAQYLGQGDYRITYYCYQ